MDYEIGENGKKIIRGVTLNQVIIYLTSPSSDSDEAQTGTNARF